MGENLFEGIEKGGDFPVLGNGEFIFKLESVERFNRETKFSEGKEIPHFKFLFKHVDSDAQTQAQVPIKLDDRSNMVKLLRSMAGKLPRGWDENPLLLNDLIQNELIGAHFNISIETSPCGKYNNFKALDYIDLVADPGAYNGGKSDVPESWDGDDIPI